MTISEFVNKVGFKVKDEDVKKVNDSISGIKNTATKLLGAIGIGFSLAAINGLVEEFGTVNNAIRNSVGELGNMEDVQNLILDTANECRASYSDMANTVSNLVKSSSDLFPVEDAAAYTGAVTKLLKSAGRSEAVIQSVMEGLNKSFQKGIVDTETLNKLLEQAPEAANILASHLGVAKTQLLDMAANGQMKVTDLKNAFLDSADEINAAFGNVDMTISDALKSIRNKWGLWLAQTDKTLGLTKTIGKVMVSAFNGAIAILNRVRTAVVWLSEKLGGTENLLKLVAIAAGAIFLALNFNKIVSGFKSISKVIGGLNFKLLAIIAVIILVALLVEDFIKFMQGQPSLLGAMLEKLGVDCEGVRQKIKDVWGKISNFLSQVWDGIKGAAKITWGAIGDFFSRHGETIKKNFQRYWGFIKDFLSTIWGILSDIISGVFGDQEKNVDGSQKTISETIVSGWQKILDAIMPILDALFAAWDAVFNALMTVVEFILGLIKKIWDKWGQDIVKYMRSLWNGLKKIIDGALNIIKGLANFITGVFSGDWKKAWEGIKQVFQGVWDAIKGIVEIVVAYIQLVIKVCVDVIKDIWSAIVGFFQDLWNKIVEIFVGIGEWFAGVFQAAWDGIKNIWSSVVGWFQGVWNGIVGVFSSVASWFSGIFSSAWEGIKNAFSAVGSFFQGIWDNIKSMFTKIGTAIGDGISGAFKSVVNGVIGFAAKIINGFIDSINWAIGVINKIPGVNINKLSRIELQGLAQGGYIGANKPTPVVIGDNKSEGEIVSPISKMRDTVIDALKTFVTAGKPSGATQVLSNSTSNRSIVQNVEINNEFNGDKAIQKQAAKTMDKSAEDVTAFLARGLAFAK